MQNVVIKDVNGNNLLFKLNEFICDQIDKLVYEHEEMIREDSYEDFIIQLLSIIQLEGEEIQEDRQHYFVGDGKSSAIDRITLNGEIVEDVFKVYTGENGMVGYYDEHFTPNYSFGKVEVSFLGE